MTLAVISDIHGNLDALDATLADIERRGIDRVVNLGDCLAGPLDAAGTADRLIERDIPTVSGNHDRALIETPREEMGLWEAWIADELSEVHLLWLAALPKVIRDGDVLFCHATPDADDVEWLDANGPGTRQRPRDLSDLMEIAQVEGARLVCGGHTHTQRSLLLPNGTRVVNPGSIGVPAFNDTRKTPNFIHQTGSPDARYAIIEPVDADYAVSLVSVPYDPSRMIDMALARGADSWATALKTGWFV